MKIAVVYSEPVSGSADSEDVLDQAILVEEALQELDIDGRRVNLDLQDTPSFFASLKEFGPDAVFNLVEEVSGQSRFLPIAACLYELAGVPYTGSPYDALVSTNDKALTKAVLGSRGIPTPDWHAYIGDDRDPGFPPPYIVKPALEHASVGIDDGSVFADGVSLNKALPAIHARHRGQPLIVERYVEGREFNVSLLEHPDSGVEVLPAAEMVFEEWPESKPRIVNYRAKWDRQAFEYSHTRRRFEPGDAPLDAIKAVCLSCWRAFGLRDYARVDLRLDTSGNAFVIEVNSNPCIARDSGFMAASAEAGYGPTETVRRIIKSTISRHGIRGGAWSR